jgi:hypothetical protein
MEKEEQEKKEKNKEFEEKNKELGRYINDAIEELQKDEEGYINIGEIHQYISNNHGDFKVSAHVIKKLKERWGTFGKIFYEMDSCTLRKLDNLWNIFVSSEEAVVYKLDELRKEYGLDESAEEAVVRELDEVQKWKEYVEYISEEIKKRPVDKFCDYKISVIIDGFNVIHNFARIDDWPPTELEYLTNKKNVDFLKYEDMEKDVLFSYIYSFNYNDLYCFDYWDYFDYFLNNPDDFEFKVKSLGSNISQRKLLNYVNDHKGKFELIQENIFVRKRRDNFA